MHVNNLRKVAALTAERETHLRILDAMRTEDDFTGRVIFGWFGGGTLRIDRDGSNVGAFMAMEGMLRQRISVVEGQLEALGVTVSNP